MDILFPNLSLLNDVQKQRFRSIYCGMCRTLRMRHGYIGTATLSYDLTFLALLRQSLGEYPEHTGRERCPTHPFKSHVYTVSRAFEYAADINVALAYHKCQDNWMDDRNVVSASEALLLKRSYDRIADAYPEQCKAIENWLAEIHSIEHSAAAGIDAPVNSTGKMLGELFCYEGGFWSESLRIIGDGLGRFIYLMDAYDDLPRDIRRNSYNPLKPYRNNADFEIMCKDSLIMMVADCTQEFEQLPIIQDVGLLRNVLYNGIWSRYAQLQKKKKDAESKGAQ